MTSPTNLFELVNLLRDRKYDFQFDDEEGIVVATPKGWVISIQWSYRHYCSSRLLNSINPTILGNAEIAIWTMLNPKFHRFEGWEDDVKGWVPTTEILRIIDYLEM